MVKSSLYSSKFHIIKQVMYNNDCIKPAAMYHTILSSLYQSASFPWERGWVYVDQFLENGFCPIEGPVE